MSNSTGMVICVVLRVVWSSSRLYRSFRPEIVSKSVRTKILRMICPVLGSRSADEEESKQTAAEGVYPDNAPNGSPRAVMGMGRSPLIEVFPVIDSNRGG